MVVHFRISQADEFADKEEISRDGAVYRWIRQVDREVIPQLDGLVYVSEWARGALLEWFPEADQVPSVVVGCVVTPLREQPVAEPMGDLVTLGNLDIVKNHRFLLGVLAEAKRRGRSTASTCTARARCTTTYSAGPGPRPRGPGDVPRVPARGAALPAGLPGLRARLLLPVLVVAIAEGMAAGLPVVVGPIGPIPELCDDGVEGRYWPLDDVSRAADILIETLDNEPERARMARAAHERFRQEFDADVIVPRLTAFLTERFHQAVTGAGEPRHFHDRRWSQPRGRRPN